MGSGGAWTSGGVSKPDWRTHRLASTPTPKPPSAPPTARPARTAVGEGLAAALLVGALAGTSPYMAPPTAHAAVAAFPPPPNGHGGRWQQGPPPPPQQQQQTTAPSFDPREEQQRRKKGKPERRYTLVQWRLALSAVAVAAARGAPGGGERESGEGGGGGGGVRTAVGGGADWAPGDTPNAAHLRSPLPSLPSGQKLAAAKACQLAGIQGGVSTMGTYIKVARPVARTAPRAPAQCSIWRVAGDARNRRREPTRGGVACAARAHRRPLLPVSSASVAGW
jgi:hypothetical protein